MSLIYLCIIYIILIYLLFKYFTRTFNYWKDKNVAGPPPVVFFGNLKNCTLRRVHISMVIKEIYRQCPDEKVVGIYRMTTPCLLIRDLDVIKKVMIKDFDLFTDRGIEFSKDGLGANLFHSDGDTWRVMRKHFSPVFTSSKLSSMTPLLLDCGDKFGKHVQSVSAQQKELEVHTLMQQYMVTTICACIFGLDIDVFSAEKKQALRTLDNLIFNMSFAYELDMMYPGILKKFNVSLFPTEVTEFFNNLVNTVIKHRNGSPSNRKDFMDSILEIRKHRQLYGTKRHDASEITLELTEGVIAAQAFSFYAAGYETSSTTLAFLMYELALHQDIQDKLINEIDLVLEKCNGQLSYDTICEMKYIGQVFDETLRLHTIVDPLVRKVNTNYTIPETNVTIEKGTTVIISLAGIHRDPKYYNNPEIFDPDRFYRRSLGTESCAYMPFGIGPRNCFGTRLAKIQSRICIIKLLSQFRVVPYENTQKSVEYDPWRMLLTPKGGIHLKLVPRT